MGLLRRVEGMEEFQKSSSGRVYFAIESDGVVRTLKDPSRAWVPYRPPLADRGPFEELLLRGAYSVDSAHLQDLKVNRAHLTKTIKYSRFRANKKRGAASSVTGFSERGCCRRPEVGR